MNRNKFSDYEETAFKLIQDYHPGQFAMVRGMLNGLDVALMVYNDEGITRPIAVIASDELLEQFIPENGELLKT